MSFSQTGSIGSLLGMDMVLLWSRPNRKATLVTSLNPFFYSPHKKKKKKNKKTKKILVYSNFILIVLCTSNLLEFS